MVKEEMVGNVVEEYMIGDTRIRIGNDAYVGKTEGEIKGILERIVKIARRAYDQGGGYKGDRAM